MGFSYNDITSKSRGLKARLTSWQVSGRLRNFTTTVPGKYGVTDFGADFDYREIVVSCHQGHLERHRECGKLAVEQGQRLLLEPA